MDNNEIFQELERRGELKDPNKLAIVEELKRRGQISPDFMGNALKKAAGEFISAPSRILRGAGVGTQHLIQGEGLDVAAERSLEARKPGFSPQSGEKIGSAIGETLPLLPLGVLGGAAAFGLSSGGEKLAEGVSPLEAAKTGGLNAGLAALTGGVVKGAGHLGEEALRNTIAAGKGLTRQAVDAVLDVPLLKRSEGAKQAVERLSSAVVDVKNTVGKHVGLLRKKLGLPDSIDQAEIRILMGKGGQINPEDALREGSKALASGDLNTLIETKLRIRAGQKFSKKSDNPQFALSKADDAALERMASSIEEAIDQIPGGATLQRAQAAYGDVLDDFSTFMDYLKTPGTSEQFIRNVIKRGESITGRLQDAVEAIKRVEERGRISNLGKAIQEVAGDQFSKSSTGGVAGTVTSAIEKTVGKGTSKATLRGLSRVPKAIQRGSSATSPLVKALTTEKKKGE